MSNDDPTEHRQHSVDGDNRDGATRTLQLLRAGQFQFGIFADEIATVATWREPTPLPHAPNSVLGVVSIQGRMLTVLDLATLPGRESESPAATVQHLIALRGDEQLALAVDELGFRHNTRDWRDVYSRSGEPRWHRHLYSRLEGIIPHRDSGSRAPPASFLNLKQHLGLPPTTVRSSQLPDPPGPNGSVVLLLARVLCGLCFVRNVKNTTEC